jgi:phosphate transport system substrate-binding protein
VLQGSTVDGVDPSFDNIAEGDYPVSRSLYFYIKHAHVGVIPGIQEFANEFMSPDAAGEEGYLIDKGLIPLLDDEFEDVMGAVNALTPMTGNEWK